MTLISLELVGKRLELTQGNLPKLSGVACAVGTPGCSGQQAKPRHEELGLQLHSMEVTSPDKLDSAFKEAIRAG